MKRFPDEQALLQELRELPEFPLKQEERYKMYETIKKGVNQQRTNRRLKQWSISLAGLAAVAVVAFALVKPMEHVQQGAGLNPRQGVTQTVDLQFKNEAGQLLATRNDLKPNAVVIQDPQTGQPEVQVEFRDPKKFEAITQSLVGKQLGIYLGGKLIEDLTIVTVIHNGKAVITGFSNKHQADDLVATLN